jgi:hypothetical protein
VKKSGLLIALIGIWTMKSEASWMTFSCLQNNSNGSQILLPSANIVLSDAYHGTLTLHLPAGDKNGSLVKCDQPGQLVLDAESKQRLGYEATLLAVNVSTIPNRITWQYRLTVGTIPASGATTLNCDQTSSQY